MEKIYRLIDDLKLNNDNAIILLARLLYKLFSSNLIVSIANVVVPFIFCLPVFNDKVTTKKAWIICLIILLIINFLGGFASGYKLHTTINAKSNQEIINNINSLIKTYSERIADKKTNGLFEMISDDVCKDLYQFFKEMFGIETRVSVVQQYHKPKSGELYSMMISRTSKKTAKLGQHRDNSKVSYNNNQKYYKKILIDNKGGQVVLLKKEIDEYFFFETNKRKRKSKIQQYIAISQKAYGKDIAFILQIDVLQKNGFGKDEDTVEDFCDKYVDPFVRILQNAYLVETVIQNC